uniref:Putative GHMP kinase family protein n=1 Tax=viral metagenome TaxID=1070528 RepID=A0A6M3L7I9_9ZZZZ
MIITRTPVRISFFGGGTDYPEWYMEHSGAVLATTIDKYCYVGLRNGKTWTSNDLPSRSGMGSSSAYTVGLLKTASTCENKTIAQLATIIERDKLNGNVGYQDQYMCAMGGFRLLKFFPTGILDKKIEDADWLSDYLMLFDTCHYRSAGKIVASQLKRIKQNEHVLKHLYDLVFMGEKCLADKDYKTFGRLLDLAWSLKRELASNVSPPDIDDIYDTAKEAGAIGGKLLGAGGGGFMLFLAEPDKQQAIKDALGLYHVPFKFDDTGSTIIYDDTH